MKKVNFNEYISDLKEKSLKIYSLMESENKGYSSKRTKRLRDPEEEYVLFLLDYMRWQRALKSGAVAKTGPRRYKLDWTKKF